MTILDTCYMCFTDGGSGVPSHWTLMCLPGIVNSYNPGIFRVGGHDFVWAACESHLDELLSGGVLLSRDELEIAMVMVS